MAAVGHAREQLEAGLVRDWLARAFAAGTAAVEHLADHRLVGERSLRRRHKRRDLGRAHTRRQTGRRRLRGELVRKAELGGREVGADAEALRDAAVSAEEGRRSRAGGKKRVQTTSD
jgi:hypothetical protein